MSKQEGFKKEQREAEKREKEEIKRAREMLKAVQKFKFVKYYSFYLRGYSEARMVLVDLANEKVYTNKAGKKAAELYQRVLADVKAGKA